MEKLTCLVLVSSQSLLIQHLVRESVLEEIELVRRRNSLISLQLKSINFFREGMGFHVYILCNHRIWCLRILSF
jgi:hypothetical protein